MLKNRLKSLNSQKLQDKSIEIINENDLEKLKGGKQGTCPKLAACGENYDSCPNLIHCGNNYSG